MLLYYLSKNKASYLSGEKENRQLVCVLPEIYQIRQDNNRTYQNEKKKQQF